MNRCDVIIPVYKSPEWVSLCVYSVFQNTSPSILGKVYLINDCDDEVTINCLKNLKNKYGEKVEIVQNKENLGFIGSTNKGLELSTSDYVLLLNTDCIITKNTIGKLIDNIKNDKTIGMICPISSNAANLTLEMYPGFSFNDMNNLLENKFKGQIFDACTVVGNCLLITKECINKVGYLDTAYGLGYGEETDYQFKAMSKGFKAKVSIDTYVYHKSEASFGTSEEKQERLNKNRDLFFSRWQEQYDAEMAKYENNDPIEYIKSSITEEEKNPKIDTIVYLNSIVQNAGGVHMVVDMVNYLAINGHSINIAYDNYNSYKEIMLFNPLDVKEILKENDIKIKNVVATIWVSVFNARVIADKKKAKLLYFVQGYECLFENGGIYGMVDTSFKLVDSIFTISNYLKEQITENYNLNSLVIPNGINSDIIYNDKKQKDIKNITMIMRNTVMKGDWMIADIIKKIDKKFKGLTINIICMNKYYEFSQLKNNTLNIVYGPLSRVEVVKLLHDTDLYIDTSLNEGFGLTPLEAMASGCLVIASNSFGINEYAKNKKNAIIINEVNDVNKYIESIELLTSDKKLCETLRENALKTSKSYDYQECIEKYINYFEKPSIIENKEELTDNDKKIIQEYISTVVQEDTIVKPKKRKLSYVSMFIPKCIKRVLKKIITYLYNAFSHE